MKRYAYTRTGLLAINHRAFLEMFLAPEVTEGNERRDAAEIVDIGGPLDHHAGWWCDSYDAIRERFDFAVNGDAAEIVLRIDSPGGDVSGCFELARHMRETAAARGKRVTAYVDGQACSAAYALACAATKIVVPPSGFVGSIGVIAARVDQTAADQAFGVKFAFVTSGKRKADGNPHKPMDAEELASEQETVDSLAALFFDWVRETRTVDAAPLEARVFHGRTAVEKGLADQVATFDEMLASLAAGEETDMSALAKARAALEAAAKGEGPEALKAKRALAALAAEKDESDDGEDAESDDDEEAVAAEKDGDEGDDDDEEAVAAEKDCDEEAVAAASAGALGAQVNKLSAELAALRHKGEKAERKRLLAGQSNEFRAACEGMPLAQVKKIVKAMPKPAVPNHAAALDVPLTRGASQGDTPGVAPTEDEQMDIAMGLRTTAVGLTRNGRQSVFGVITPAQAKAHLAAAEGGK